MVVGIAAERPSTDYRLLTTCRCFAGVRVVVACQAARPWDGSVTTM